MGLSGLGYYHFTTGLVDGHEAVISRTGYTGEDGFEIRVSAEAAAPLWQSLLAAGAPEGCLPCGLGARDTLRLEAKMCLYGNDIDETTTLVEAGLGWIVSLDERKGEFLGRAVLAEQKAKGTARRLVGFELVGRGIARHGYDVVLGGKRLGQVTSGTFSPYLQKSIGLCYLPAASSAVGTEFEVDVRGRLVPARVVATPFYKRTR
jgi:aminomethyltransferase